MVWLWTWLLLSGCGTNEVKRPVHYVPGSEATATDSGATGACARPVSEYELGLLNIYAPDAVCGDLVAVDPAQLLAQDADLGNGDLLILRDGEGAALMAARRVYTPVFCTAGVCEAVVFMLVYEPDGTFVALFHPDEERLPLRKYWADEYLSFTPEDMALLSVQLAAPPDLLLTAEDADALVDGSHGTAPTWPEYQPYVVRGAAFTCFVVLDYSVRTQAALASLGSTP